MRPGLLRHRKFTRLARLVGSKALALGHLEMVWEVAYENGDDLLGDAADLEYQAEWSGEAGKLAEALVASGFIDESPEGLRVHDLWDHAPEYVTKRAEREADRKQKGETISSLRSQAGKKGAASRWQPDSKRQTLAMDSMANGGTPTPAPTPAPTPDTTSVAIAAPTTVERLRVAVSQRLGRATENGGKGMPSCASRKLGQVVRDANAAVDLRGFDAVVEALQTAAEAMKADGREAETFGAFGYVLSGLARPDAPERAPPTPRTSTKPRCFAHAPSWDGIDPEQAAKDFLNGGKQHA